MAEYAAMVVVTAVATTLYLGGWYFPFVYGLTEAKGYHNAYVAISVIVFLAKMGILLYGYFWLRWTLPRFRYDQLMDIGWKWMIPAALINIVGQRAWSGRHSGPGWLPRDEYDRFVGPGIGTNGDRQSHRDWIRNRESLVDGRYPVINK